MTASANHSTHVRRDTSVFEGRNGLILVAVLSALATAFILFVSGIWKSRRAGAENYHSKAESNC